MGKKSRRPGRAERRSKATRKSPPSQTVPPSQPSPPSPPVGSIASFSEAAKKYLHYFRHTGVCHHGCPDFDKDPALVAFFQNFGDYMELEIQIKRMLLANADTKTLEALAALGANLLLQPQQENSQAQDLAFRVAVSMVGLECALMYGLVVLDEYKIHAEAAKTFFDLLSCLDSRKKLVRYFASYLDCACLKDERKATRRDNTGRCFGCGKTFQTDSLFDCSRCQCVHYCLRDCQLQNWALHMKFCKRISKHCKENHKAATDEQVAT